MDLFECYTFEEAIINETGLTISQPQGYYKLIANIQRVGNLISNYKPYLKRGTSHTEKIAETPQGGESSLKFVMICCSEEAKLGDKWESSSRIVIRSRKVGVIKPFVNPNTCEYARLDT